MFCWPAQSMKKHDGSIKVLKSSQNRQAKKPFPTSLRWKQLTSQVYILFQKAAKRYSKATILAFIDKRSSWLIWSLCQHIFILSLAWIPSNSAKPMSSDENAFNGYYFKAVKWRTWSSKKRKKWNKTGSSNICTVYHLVGLYQIVSDFRKAQMITLINLSVIFRSKMKKDGMNQQAIQKSQYHIKILVGCWDLKTMTNNEKYTIRGGILPV